MSSPPPRRGKVRVGARRVSSTQSSRGENNPTPTLPQLGGGSLQEISTALIRRQPLPPSSRSRYMAAHVDYLPSPLRSCAARRSGGGYGWPQCAGGVEPLSRRAEDFAGRDLDGAGRGAAWRHPGRTRDHGG